MRTKKSAQFGLIAAGAIATSLLAAPGAGAAVDAAFDPLEVVNGQGLLADPAATTEALATGTENPANTTVAPVSITPVAPVPGVGRATAVADVWVADDSDFGYVTGESVRGTQASFVVLDEPSAPTSHDFAIAAEGAAIHLVPNADGSVTITNESGDFINLLQVPWAKDADGTALSTWYTVAGNVVTQHIDVSGATYPVVADPEAGCGVAWCSIYFNRSETHDIATAGFLALGGAATACAVGGAVGVAACGIAAASIGATATYADNHGECVGLSFWGVPPVVGWNPFTHADEYCY